MLRQLFKLLSKVTSATTIEEKRSSLRLVTTAINAVTVAQRTGHPYHRKFGRAPWGNTSSWKKPHQGKRERIRRLVQLAKGQLSGPNRFISQEAARACTTMRLHAIGLIAPEDAKMIIDPRRERAQHPHQVR